MSVELSTPVVLSVEPDKVVTLVEFVKLSKEMLWLEKMAGKSDKETFGEEKFERAVSVKLVVLAFNVSTSFKMLLKAANCSAGTENKIKRCVLSY